MILINQTSSNERYLKIAKWNGKFVFMNEDQRRRLFQSPDLSFCPKDGLSLIVQINTLAQHCRRGRHKRVIKRRPPTTILRPWERLLSLSLDRNRDQQSQLLPWPQLNRSTWQKENYGKPPKLASPEEKVEVAEVEVEVAGGKSVRWKNYHGENTETMVQISVADLWGSLQFRDQLCAETLAEEGGDEVQRRLPSVRGLLRR